MDRVLLGVPRILGRLIQRPAFAAIAWHQSSIRPLSSVAPQRYETRKSHQGFAFLVRCCSYTNDQSHSGGQAPPERFREPVALVEWPSPRQPARALRHDVETKLAFLHRLQMTLITPRTIFHIESRQPLAKVFSGNRYASVRRCCRNLEQVLDLEESLNYCSVRRRLRRGCQRTRA